MLRGSFPAGKTVAWTRVGTVLGRNGHHVKRGADRQSFRRETPVLEQRQLSPGGMLLNQVWRPGNSSMAPHAKTILHIKFPNGSISVSYLGDERVAGLSQPQETLSGANDCTIRIPGTGINHAKEELGWHKAASPVCSCQEAYLRPIQGDFYRPGVVPQGPNISADDGESS